MNDFSTTKEPPCDHHWELSYVKTEPMGEGTAEYEVAYLVCRNCGGVKKEKVK